MVGRLFLSFPFDYWSLFSTEHLFFLVGGGSYWEVLGFFMDGSSLFHTIAKEDLFSGIRDLVVSMLDGWGHQAAGQKEDPIAARGINERDEFKS